VGDQDDFRAKFEKCLEDDIEAIGLGWSWGLNSSDNAELGVEV
jgi:hypothetical protein